MRTLLIVLCLASLSSCQTVKKDAKAAESAFVDCAKGDVAAALAKDGFAIIGQVAAILAGGDTWKTDLDKLKPQIGSDAVSCATKAAVAIFAASAPKGLETPPPVSRGNAYLADVRFK
jgi:hypothetical protein